MLNKGGILLKNKPTEKVQSNVPANKSLNQLKGQSLKYSFVYLRSWSIMARLFKLLLMAAPFFLMAIAFPALGAILMGTSIIAVFIGFVVIPMPKSYGYGILHENHVEISHNKKKYLIEYSKIWFVEMRVASTSGLSCLILSEDCAISISPYNSFFNKKATMHSVKVIKSFQKALERKVNDAGGSKSRPAKLVKSILR